MNLRVEGYMLREATPVIVPEAGGISGSTPEYPVRQNKFSPVRNRRAPVIAYCGKARLYPIVRFLIFRNEPLSR